MDIKALKAKREEQDRLIAHFERFGEDTWGDGTALLVISKVTDDEDGSGWRYSRSCWIKEDGTWWNTNSSKPSSWTELVNSLATKRTITDIQIGDNWRSFDQAKA